MIQLGFRLQGMINLLISPIGKDFIEYFLHHFITISMIVVAYFSNHITIGLAIFITMDLSDIFLTISRALVDTTSKMWLILNSGMVFITWFGLRILCYIEILWYCLIVNQYIGEVDGLYICVTLLVSLLIMNIY